MKQEPWRITLIGILISLFLPGLVEASPLVGTGLTISPITQNLSAQPGESVTASIKVFNPTDKPVTAYPVVLDFRSDGTSGTPTFYKSSADGDRFSLSQWFKAEQGSLVVPPEQSVQFDYRLRVPLNTEAGGHYGAALFSDSVGGFGADNVKVDVKSMVGTLILLRVAGDIRESAKLISFLANKTFSFSPHVILNYTIKNVGNIHIQPYGELNIKNWRGVTVDTQKVNTVQGNILPDSTRLFTADWNGDNMSFGHYTAQLASFYGTANQPLGSELTFWIIPLWLIITIVVSILIAIILIRFRPRIQFQTGSIRNSKKR